MKREIERIVSIALTKEELEKLEEFRTIYWKRHNVLMSRVQAFRFFISEQHYKIINEQTNEVR